MKKGLILVVSLSFILLGGCDSLEKRELAPGKETSPTHTDEQQEIAKANQDVEKSYDHYVASYHLNK